MVVDLLEDFRAGDDLSGAECQVFEDAELAWSQIDLIAVDKGAPRVEIHGQRPSVTALDWRSKRRRISARTRASSSSQANGLTR